MLLSFQVKIVNIRVHVMKVFVPTLAKMLRISDRY